MKNKYDYSKVSREKLENLAEYVCEITTKLDTNSLVQLIKDEAIISTPEQVALELAEYCRATLAVGFTSQIDPTLAIQIRTLTLKYIESKSRFE